MTKKELLKFISEVFSLGMNFGTGKIGKPAADIELIRLMKDFEEKLRGDVRIIT